MLGNFEKKILKNDIEYNHKINSQFDKYTMLWGIKRIIKKSLAVIPGFKKFELYAYFMCHKFRPKHWLLLFINIYVKKEIYISFQSGFGDMLETYPYYRKAKEKFPMHKIYAVIHHPDFCKFKEMSFCKGSFLNVNGKKIDYVKEFIDTNPSIDGIIYDDCWGDGYIYGHPFILKDILGFAFDKQSFSQDTPYLFNEEDKNLGDKYIINNKLDSGKTVAIHFKTAKEKIIKIINFMLTDEYFKYKKLNFLLFGVVESDLELLILSHGFNVVNISNSYLKGITTRQLIYIASKSNLFLGGRGGFNAIYYLLDVPTINIFDEQGVQEIENGMWPSNLWKENRIKRLYFEKDENSLIIKDIKKIL